MEFFRKIEILPTGQKSQPYEITYDIANPKILFKMSKDVSYVRSFDYYNFGEHLRGNHLYLLDCAEKVDENDWLFCRGGIRYVTRLNPDGKTFVDDGYMSGLSPCKDCYLYGYEKVIASTRLLMNRNSGCNIYLPQFSQSFIDDYMRAFNDGHPIKRLLVEYRDIFKCGSYTLKLNHEKEITARIPKEEQYIKEIERIEDNEDEFKIFKDNYGNNFLNFFYERLINNYNENPQIDYMIKLNEIRGYVDRKIKKS